MLFALPPTRERRRHPSIDDFAKELGISRETIYRWKGHKSAPDEHSRQRLSEVDPKHHSPEWFSLDGNSEPHVTAADVLSAVEAQAGEIVQLRAELDQLAADVAQLKKRRVGQGRA